MPQSKFIKTLGPPYRKFFWQRGYGMFSVSPKSRDDAESYVRDQPEHHRTRSFQDEYRIILESNDVEYDETYLWD